VEGELGEERAAPADGAAPPPPGARAGASEPAAHRRAARVAAESAAVADLWVRQPAYIFAASFSSFCTYSAVFPAWIGLVCELTLSVLQYLCLTSFI
jgi:hypothetical protein